MADYGGPQAGRGLAPLNLNASPVVAPGPGYGNPVAAAYPNQVQTNGGYGQPQH